MRIFLIILHLLIYLPSFPQNSDSVRLAKELNNFASIINAEASGESFKGKLLVGSVILNRINNSDFNNSMLEVITEKRQFEGFNSNLYYPTNESLIAALLLLEIGPLTQALYFMRIDGNKEWLRYLKRNHDFIMVEENHIFFK